MTPPSTRRAPDGLAPAPRPRRANLPQQLAGLASTLRDPWFLGSLLLAVLLHLGLALLLLGPADHTARGALAPRTHRSARIKISPPPPKVAVPDWLLQRLPGVDPRHDACPGAAIPARPDPC